MDYQFAGGVQGVVPCGTTGESPTLDYDEHERVIQLTVEYTAGRGIVMAGTGSNSTREAVEMTQEAEAAGANAALLVAPYYNKPTQEGLFRHFKAIADNTKLPIMLYSIPGRCGIEIGVDTVVRLAEACPNIRAIKEAGGNADRVSQMKMLLPAEFDILSGDDSLTLPFMSVGGVGVVSVAGNLIPAEMNRMVQAALAGRWAEAQSIHAQFNPLFSAFLKLSTNPIPIKTALALKGICDAELRLPMCELGEAQVNELRQTMINVGILAE
ncbi:4-hydroxy-tetrahydrodipicolinate synthase [Verrucomicrobium spinosum]|uniref:4-hydroxy-tetrahydrodipicolinate synthase n=1 Tax=Verrucomicrobium spinosum TaxID=2736 RepID=UPI000A8F8266|nr:4-hydroxy-tetrahydrodipicolinate synthase [Verrucomicrobium spinosum]